ncbi:MAG: 2-C-methyl-D-erythritol 2,4-cyclodiphosphate synthase [Planctomycetota bacterium]|nr:2-C-methyl-D-erythritol 2,4-cyclodiphosphate synthase [Planctomycetota bacterium]
MRVGIGYDIHEFDSGGVLVLGGVKIPGAWGLRGHSDADVLLHAVADAMLGAAGLGDLGDHFPDTDPQWKDVPSAAIVAEVRTKVEAKGLVPGNVDVTVVAERPKLGPHRLTIRDRVAALLGIEAACVNVKATTHEGLGALGRAEGIAAMAVVLLTEAEA